MSENDNTALVAEILSSYLSNNTVAPAVDRPKKMEPAVPVKKSVTPDALFCICCGKPFKSLKRHLQSEHGLSPDEYRAAFGLKADYPTVAPNYSAQRSALALSAGLGRKAGESVASKKVAVKKPGGKKTGTKTAAE